MRRVQTSWFPRFDVLDVILYYRMRRAAPLILLLLLICLCAPFARTQVSATLSGLLTDPSGAAVAAASVTATNLDTGLSRDTLTDQAGRYRFLALPVGRYE